MKIRCKLLGFNIDSETFDKFEKYCKENDKDKSKVLRKLLEEFLKENA